MPFLCIGTEEGLICVLHTAIKSCLVWLAVSDTAFHHHHVFPLNEQSGNRQKLSRYIS